MARKTFHGDSQGNTQILRVSGRAIAVDLELTWQHLLSEFRPKQTKAASVNRVDLSLWASMAARMITSSRSNNCYLARTTNYQLPTSSGADGNRCNTYSHSQASPQCLSHTVWEEPGMRLACNIDLTAI